MGTVACIPTPVNEAGIRGGLYSKPRVPYMGAPAGAALRCVPLKGLRFGRWRPELSRSEL